ncbi:MAG: hypothetical protein KDM91_18505, partial [Verrucomicrobiae bacterium]|nr:hypothetical protein [Verrucomicrobiae bacterium]
MSPRPYPVGSEFGAFRSNRQCQITHTIDEKFPELDHLDPDEQRLLAGQLWLRAVRESDPPHLARETVAL